jgi:hypothetical protein
VFARTAFLVWILGTGCLFVFPQDSSTAHVESLIQRLGTGNIKDEDVAKNELSRHPRPDALPLLLKALPSSDATVRDEIIEILDSYKDPAKIPALIAYRANRWGEKSIDSQLVELGAPSADALVKSLPENCDPGSRSSGYADWVGTVLREIEPEGTRAMLSGLMTRQPCLHQAARSGLVVPRPGPPMAPPPTVEDEEMDSGLFLLVDATESEDAGIHDTAIRWIRTQQSRSWTDMEYSQFLDAIIETYRENVGGKTRVEIARLLAMYHCPRVDRFMRAGVHSPSAAVRAIAREYLAPHRPGKSVSPYLAKNRHIAQNPLRDEWNADGLGAHK